MGDSIFTKIINKEIPAKIRYEDDDFIVIDDIHPQAPVHVLLITKKQITSLEDLSEQDKLLTTLLPTARRVAKKLGINQNYKLIMNIGLQIQEVKHIHLHILGGWQKNEVTLLQNS